MRKNSVKNTRINAEVQRELSTLIREECKDPRIHPLTSVVAAEVAPDLKTAKIYISVLGDEEAIANYIKGPKECGFSPAFQACEVVESSQYAGADLCGRPLHCVWCVHVKVNR